MIISDILLMDSLFQIIAYRYINKFERLFALQKNYHMYYYFWQHI